MPTENEVMKWVTENWPSIAATGVFSMVYVRLHRLFVRLESAEKDARAAMKLAKKLVRSHLKRHGEDVDDLFSGEEENK